MRFRATPLRPKFHASVAELAFAMRLGRIGLITCESSSLSTSTIFKTIDNQVFDTVFLEHGAEPP